MKSNKVFERVIHGIFLILGLVTVACVLLITVYLVISGIPAIMEIGLWDFLFGKIWDPAATDPQYGILPFILSSIYGTAGSLVIGVPIGFFTAVYLSKKASPKVKEWMSAAVSLLAGIPSVVYGLVGMMVLVPGIREIFHLPDGASLLAGALTLVIMNLPTIMRTTQESLKTVPQSYREGAFGLGAGKWRVIRTVVLPNCVEGVITGCILSVGRIVGESAALLFTAGFAHALNGFFEALSSSGSTLTVALYVYATEDGNFEVAFAIAAILMILTLLINLSAMLIGKYFERKSKV